MSSHKRMIAVLKELGEKIEKLYSKQHNPKSDLQWIFQEHIEGINEELEENKLKLANLQRDLAQVSEIFSEKLEHLSEGMEEIRKQDGWNIKGRNHRIALTTGPVIRCDMVSKLYVEVLNNTDIPQTVRITVFDLEQAPKQHIEHRLVTIHSNHGISEVFHIGQDNLNLRRFEVQVESLGEAQHGIFIYIAGVEGCEYKIIESNVFRHEQLVPLIKS